MDEGRRRFITGAAVIGGLAVLPPFAPGEVAGAATGADSRPVGLSDGLSVLPRDQWGDDLAPRGPMGIEDVRFLLVHHTATSNTITSQRSLIRNVFAFHTGPRKQWPDVAYNFFVGPDGTVWEGRAGSLDGPVVASATGGNQGFSQLVCLLGNFESTAPTAAAQASLVRLLAHLAVVYDLSTWKGSQATFVSRGSNKLPRGSNVSTPVISGHRDVTFTACPGDRAYDLLPDWRRRVHPLVTEARRQPGLQPAQRRSLEAP
ncbi:MAG: N-acetylmuramoyl-L-alanine amidase [Ilumatobacter sp.]|uniref:N-acetylmuramoyl-L-alanine amidase n=1 Tax=Ilumatobacter sp. TaxID=1967498 RepID=UPI003C727F61